MRKIISILLVMVMCLSVFAACTKTPAGPTQSPTGTTATTPTPTAGGAKTTFGLTPFKDKQTLRIGFFAGSPLSIPFYIADQEGFFKELNIEIVYETFTNGPAMMEANADWDIAGAGVGGVLTGMVGYDLKVIGISDYEKNLALLTRKDTKLAKAPDDPASWKGSSWLYPVGTTAQAVLVAQLEKLGLGINDIKTINMDVASALTGFKGGEGDGLGVWNAIAFRAEDEGFVRLTDAGELGFVAPCATLATEDALKNKRDLVKAAYAVFYKTVDWMNENDANMKEAIGYYLENCQDEGIAVDQSIAERVMKWYAAPSTAKSIEIMTKTAPDAAGKYTKRDLTQAERDFMVGMDFFISQQKYKAEDRNKILDNTLIDPSIAVDVKKMLDDQGIKY